MKRFLSLIPLFFATLSWGADGKTTGDIGLLLPTTGVIDISRSWADKYNKNFQMVASTITDMRGSIVNISNSTGLLAIGIAQSTNTFAAGIAASSGSWAIGIGGSTNALATGIAASSGALASGIANSTKTYAGTVALDTTTLNNRFLNGAVGFSNQGVPQGNMTMLNFSGAGVSGACVNSTCTATVNGAAAGGALSWNNSGYNSSTAPAAVGSSITVGGNLGVFQTPGTSVTIRDMFNIQYATGLLWKYNFRETSTGTAVGTYRVYDTVFSTRFGVVGQGCMTLSTMGVNNGNGIHVNYTGAGSTISVAQANLADNIGGTTGKLSVETWVKFDRAATGLEDFIERTAGAQAGWYLRRDNSQQLTFNITDSGGTTSSWTSTACLNPGSWHHIICTYDGAKVTGSQNICFVDNNTMSNTSTDAGTAIGAPNGILNIGGADAQNRMTGAWFAMVAEYDWALNKAAVGRQFSAALVREP